MESVDKGHFVGALLLDFTKAFDSVPHQLLLQELQSIGPYWVQHGPGSATTSQIGNKVVTYEQFTE